MTRTNVVHLGIKLPRDAKIALCKLARADERSVSAYLRRLIQKAIHEQQTAPAVGERQ